MEREVTLKGGHATPIVVRVEETVRRTNSSWSPAVHALLRHLEEVGFRGAPRFIGVDDQNREILSYIKGQAASGAPLPKHVWSEDALAAIGQLLHDLHEATASFVPPAGANWQTLPRTPKGGTVICHNDAAPWNTIFYQGKPVAFVDWDTAGPAPPIWDLAYAAWHWVPLWVDKRAIEHGFTALETRGRRLRLLCDAYGLEDRSQLLATVRRRIRSQLDRTASGSEEGLTTFVNLVKAGALVGMQSDIAFLDQHRSELQKALA